MRRVVWLAYQNVRSLLKAEESEQEIRGKLTGQALAKKRQRTLQ